MKPARQLRSQSGAAAKAGEMPDRTSNPAASIRDMGLSIGIRGRRIIRSVTMNRILRFPWILPLLLAGLIATPALAQQPEPAAPAPESTPATTPATTTVVLTTALGEIHIAVETERAPVTAANFLRYVDNKRFDGMTFYRAHK